MSDSPHKPSSCATAAPAGITRKDFLNGLALGTGLAMAGLPARALAQSAAGNPDGTILSPLQAQGITPDNPAYYPPALTGMRGSHPGSYPAGHALRDGEAWVRQNAQDTGEHYDLVIVGAGISGLASAYYWRKARPDARILLLDNHDDFGGHAKRNEFKGKNGRTLLCYGGTQALEGVSHFSKTVTDLLGELGVEPKRFENYYDFGFFKRHGLVNATLFDRETFGRDTLVRDASTITKDGSMGFAITDYDAFAAYLNAAPIAPKARADMIALQKGWPVDPLAGLTLDQKIKKMQFTPFSDFLLKTVGVHPDVVKLLQKKTHGGYGQGIDAVDAVLGANFLTPGLARALGFAAPEGEPEKYIYHFPDGNASIARILVRKLVPDVAPGSTMEDIVTARFHYPALDRPDQPVRIRLNSTVVRTRNMDQGGVELHYMRQGKAYRVVAKQAIMACWHMIIPYLMPELPEVQKEAMHANVKVPLIYGSVTLKNWQALKNLGVGQVYSPGGYFSDIMMDFPISMGGYAYTAAPEEPCALHLVRTPCAPGLPARDQHRIGRADIYATPFAEFERQIVDQFTRAFAAGGFVAARDIAEITINRWPHGYCYFSMPLWDGDVPFEQSTYVKARQRFGNVAIANTDGAGDAETHLAIEQAHRAVHELLG